MTPSRGGAPGAPHLFLMFEPTIERVLPLLPCPKQKPDDEHPHDYAPQKLRWVHPTYPWHAPYREPACAQSHPSYVIPLSAPLWVPYARSLVLYTGDATCQMSNPRNSLRWQLGPLAPRNTHQKTDPGGADEPTTRGREGPERTTREGVHGSREPCPPRTLRGRVPTLSDHRPDPIR